MESLKESRESPSTDFVLRLYAIYVLLYFFVLVLDYFLWTSKFWFPPFRDLVDESYAQLRWQTLFAKIMNLFFPSKYDSTIRHVTNISVS